MENVEELKVGSFVTICSRSQPGVNKLGGYAKITKCHYDEDGDGGELVAIDVKYIVETGGEKNVSLDFVEKKEETDGNGKDKAATPINTRRSSRRSHPVRSVPDNPAIIKKGRVKSTSSNKDTMKRDENACSVVNPELDLNRNESIPPHTSKAKPDRGKKDRKITNKANPKQLSKKAKIKNDSLATRYPGTASLSTSCIAKTNMNKHKISETTSRKSELNPKEKKRKINLQKKESKARRKSVVGLELNRTQTTLSNFMPSTKKSKIPSTNQNNVSIPAAKHFQKEDISPDSESMVLDEIILDGGSKTCSALLPPEMELNQHREFSNASDDYSIYCKMPNQSRNKTKPKSHKKLNLGNTEATTHQRPSQSLQTQEARSIITANRKDLSFSFFTSSSSRDSFMQQDKNKNKKISVHKSIEGDLKRESMSNQSSNKMNKKATKKSYVTNINKENNMKNVEGTAALKQEQKSSANVSRVSGRLFQDVMSRSSVGRPDGIILVKDRSNGTTTDKFRSIAGITKTVETNESRREDRQETFRKVFLNCMLGLDNIHVDKLLETINERMISQTKFTKEEIETNLSKLQDMNRLMVSESVVYMI